MRVVSQYLDISVFTYCGLKNRLEKKHKKDISQGSLITGDDCSGDCFSDMNARSPALLAEV